MMVRLGWWALLVAIAGEVLVPFVLGLFYRGYRHDRTALSVLGSSDSPVRTVYNLWMLLAGILFLLSLPSILAVYRAVSPPLAWACAICLGIFAVGACIFTCFFSVHEDKRATAASKIHGAGSAIGFMLLLLVPLFLALLSFRQGDRLMGILCALSFLLALGAFVLFIMADKPRVQHSVLAREGLWQRLNLLFMYLPLTAAAVRYL